MLCSRREKMFDEKVRMRMSVAGVECVLLAVLSSKVRHKKTTCDDRDLHVCTSKGFVFAVSKWRPWTSGYLHKVPWLEHCGVASRPGTYSASRSRFEWLVRSLNLDREIASKVWHGTKGEAPRDTA
jgi:hypothetical protein